MNESTRGDEGNRGFAVFLGQIDEGAFHAELSGATRELVTSLNEFANRFHRNGKGELTITLAFDVDEKGVTSVVGGFKAKLPKIPKAKSQFFLTAGGNLTLENPRQQKLPLREVAGAAPTRELAPEVQPARSI